MNHTSNQTLHHISNGSHYANFKRNKFMSVRHKNSELNDCTCYRTSAEKKIWEKEMWKQNWKQPERRCHFVVVFYGSRVNTHSQAYFRVFVFLSQLHWQLRENFTAGLKLILRSYFFDPNLSEMKVEFYLILLMGR